MGYGLQVTEAISVFIPSAQRSLFFYLEVPEKFLIFGVERRHGEP